MSKTFSKFLLPLLLAMVLLVIFLPSFSALAADKTADKGGNKASACTPEWYSGIPGQSSEGGAGFFERVSKVCWACGDCTVCDFLGMADGIARFLLSIMGGVALIMFIYGGFSFIIAAGNSERITKAKGVLVNAVIGIIIILFAWELVNFVIGVMAGQKSTEAANIFGSQKWYEVCAKK